jgi:gliding motility associated protien GldN
MSKKINMNLAVRFASLILFIFSSLAVMGQAETRIITESSDPLEDIYIDDVVAKRFIFEKQVLAYEPVREADVPWEKRIWRVIDTREKVNLPFSYPEKPFFSILAEAAKNGEIKVFADDKFRDMLTPDEVSSILVSTDTSDVIDPVTYEVERQPTSSEINPTDIIRFRIKEMWYFDKESSRMLVRILGIAPLLEVFDEGSGAFKYELPLFWVYYPEVREVLSKHTVFNDMNDASVITWNDLFEMRSFSSYIYKQSNVHDVRLIDVYPDNGVDRLLESDKIKSELFNWEHDLWTY